MTIYYTALTREVRNAERVLLNNGIITDRVCIKTKLSKDIIYELIKYADTMEYIIKYNWRDRFNAAEDKYMFIIDNPTCIRNPIIVDDVRSIVTAGYRYNILKDYV